MFTHVDTSFYLVEVLVYVFKNRVSAAYHEYSASIFFRFPIIFFLNKI